MKKNINLTLIFLLPGMLMGTGCKKWIALDIVQNKTQSELVFADAANANLAINGIYRLSRDNFQSPLSTFSGMAADELTNLTGSPIYEVYIKNQIQPNDATLPWRTLYKVIYACNAAVEGLTSNSNISEVIKQQYIAEAKFNRALSYFYLVNFFGQVPLVTTTNVATNKDINRSDTSVIYNQILADLNDAIPNLQTDYALTGMGRIRANKWAAVALLARVNLYLKNYKAAEDNATLVINAGLYSLLSSPNNIMGNDNAEAILQWGNANTESNLLASNLTANPPQIVVTQKLLDAYETNDLRKSAWIKTKVVSSISYNYPFKFTTTTVNPNERYTILRLGEQYLIRAEARAMQNNFKGAIDDVNLIRQKHGGLILPLPPPIDQTVALDVILHERYVDLFYEGAHRWFDLKRTGRVNNVMAVYKPLTWKETAVLYPVPQADRQNNPNLDQNPGYE